MAVMRVSGAASAARCAASRPSAGALRRAAPSHGLGAPAGVARPGVRAWAAGLCGAPPSRRVALKRPTARARLALSATAAAAASAGKPEPAAQGATRGAHAALRTHPATAKARRLSVSRQTSPLAARRSDGGIAAAAATLAGSDARRTPLAAPAHAGLASVSGLWGEVTSAARAQFQAVDGLWGQLMPMTLLFFCMAFVNTLLDAVKVRSR
jgi:hypothetical protein